MLRVREVNDVQQLQSHAADWKRLLCQTQRATFFQSLEWLTVYWRHFGEGQKLRVLIVGDEEPVGILPLVVRREPTKAGALRFLTYPLDNWGSFYGPVGPLPEETISVALRHIRNTRRDWDVLELRWTHAEQVRRGEIARAMDDLGMTSQLSTVDQSAIVRLDGTWDEYFAARTSKWRNNYRRWERRLADRGAVRHVRYRPRGEAHGEVDPRWDLYDACEDISSRSWQAIDNDTPGTTLCHASVRNFLRDAHEVAARAGAVDLNLLLLNDNPLAFAYNYHYRGHLYGLRIGFDSSLAKEGAGNLLYTRTIQSSFEIGDRLYDMGPGSLPAKQYLLTDTEPVSRYSHFARTAVRAQLVRLKRRLSANGCG